jgi:Flp pilus assembly protein TadD
LDFYEALLLGQNDRSHETGVKEYNYAPFDMESNTTSMITALQFVYQPRAIDSIFEVIPMKGLDLENCALCGYRYQVKAWSDIELKRYKKVIKMLEPFANGIDYLFLKRPLIAAYIKSGNMSAAEEILSRLQVTMPPEKWKDMFLYEAKIMILASQISKADEYLDKILETNIDDNTLEFHADALYYKRDYENAEKLLTRLYDKDKNNHEVVAKLAISMYKNGKENEAEVLISELDGMRENYQYGEIDYSLALYYAAIEDISKTRRHLLKAVADGKRYQFDKFHNDPDLQDYFKLDSFKSILTFWH